MVELTNTHCCENDPTSIPGDIRQFKNKDETCFIVVGVIDRSDEWHYLCLFDDKLKSLKLKPGGKTLYSTIMK